MRAIMALYRFRTRRRCCELRLWPDASVAAGSPFMCVRLLYLFMVRVFGWLVLQGTPTTAPVGCQAGDGLVIGFPGMRTGGASPCPGMGLRLLERGAGACQVISGNHDLHAPERGVGKIDVDVSVGELAGQLAQSHGPVLDVHHQDLALVGDPYPSAPERRSASGHGLAV